MGNIDQLTRALTPAKHEPSELALHRRLGHELIPLHRWDLVDAEGRDRGKSPRDVAWRQTNYSKFDPAAHMASDGNVGVRLRATDLVVDVDPRNFDEGDDPVKRFCRDFGVDLATWPTVHTGSDGRHHYGEKPADVDILASLEKYPGLEFKSYRTQCVAAGSLHPSGRPYAWDLFSAEAAPRVPPSLVEALRRPPPSQSAGAGGEHTPEEIEAMLSRLDVRKFDNNADWMALMFACHHASRGEARQEFLTWSSGDPRYHKFRALNARRWDSAHKDMKGSITVRSLYWILEKHGLVLADVVPQRKAQGAFEEATAADVPEGATIARVGEAPEASMGPEVIRLGDGDSIHAVVDAMGRAIERHMPLTVFHRSGEGSLVRIRRVERVDITNKELGAERVREGVVRPEGVHTVHEATPEWIMLEVSRTGRVRFEKYDGRGKKDQKYKRVDPPLEVIRLLRETEATPFRPLSGISTVPTLTRSEPGYDAETGFYLAFKRGEFPPVPDEPTRDDAVAALDAIAGPMRGFPFKDGASRSVALSAVLSGVTRHAMPTCPLHAFTAPVPRTGKGLLVQYVTWIVAGNLPSTITWTGDDAENEKRLVSLMLAGDPIVNIDNVNPPLILGGDTVCIALTNQHMNVRILGKSEMPVVDTRRLLLANGNQLRIAGDLVQRSVLCSLDANMEFPEKRRFDFNALEDAQRMRPRLVVAALTVLKAYKLHGLGAPGGHRPLGGFEGWDRLVRGALLWCGEDDPVKTQAAVVEDDPKRQGRVEILQALSDWDYLGEGFRLARLHADNSPDAVTAKETVASHLKNKAWSMSEAGSKLEEMVGRPTGGMVLRKEHVRNKPPTWRVERCDHEGEEGS